MRTRYVTSHKRQNLYRSISIKQNVVAIARTPQQVKIEYHSILIRIVRFPHFTIRDRLVCKRCTTRFYDKLPYRSRPTMNRYGAYHYNASRVACTLRPMLYFDAADNSVAAVKHRTKQSLKGGSDTIAAEGNYRKNN